MKVIILAGGYGTRLAEYTDKIPKPMVKIGKKPILSHIMETYQKYGYKKFIIAAGYKKEIIEDYYKDTKEFDIQIVDTGEDTMTGGRLLRLEKFIEKEENFFMTYGDGLSNIDLHSLIDFHKKQNKIATLSAVRPLPRFGNITLKGDKVIEFKEKDSLKEGWINGGFFVLNRKVFDYISDKEDCIFEREPLQRLSEDGQLMAYKHEGFWHPMDTLRDKRFLNDILKKNKAPWL